MFSLNVILQNMFDILKINWQNISRCKKSNNGSLSRSDVVGGKKHLSKLLNNWFSLVEQNLSIIDSLTKEH